VVNNYPGWLADMIQEHRCGVVVPPEDSIALVNSLIELYNKPELCKQMGHAGRQLAENQFSRKFLSDHFCRFIEQQTFSL
jgi:glycosyltransferase involved in cell wall biosynthesis